MKFTIITLFPEMFSGPFDHSIIKNAKAKGLIEINYINIRDFGEGKHKIVDDTEYGGGVGMVMKVDVVHKAILHSKCNDTIKKCQEKIILLSATGKTFNQKIAQTYSNLDHLIIICGHYEGIDERIKHYVDDEISIGDFILTGGEIPAMLLVDSISRLVLGVLPVGAAENESFSELDNEIFLEYPHFTKPQNYNGQLVPQVLLSGNHNKINEWRKKASVATTIKKRPDLLKKK